MEEFQELHRTCEHQFEIHEFYNVALHLRYVLFREVLTVSEVMQRRSVDFFEFGCDKQTGTGHQR